MGKRRGREDCSCLEEIDDCWAESERLGLLEES
jgi:hypothetical protein